MDVQLSVRTAPRQHGPPASDSALNNTGRWTIGSIDVSLLQRTVLGWDPTQYAEWLRDTLIDQLVTPRTNRWRDHLPSGNGMLGQVCVTALW
jgi:hypothetical protein